MRLNELGVVTVLATKTFSAFTKGLMLCLALCVAGQTNAQSPFRVKAYVNGTAITEYEFVQRQLLLKVLRTPGDLAEQALEALINDRLQLQAASAAGFSASPADIEAGIAELAARTELSPKEYLAALNEAGVATDSFRDLVRASVVWREYIRARFAPRSSITDAEVEQALALLGATGSASVQISELFLPASTAEMRAQNMPLANELSRIRSEAEFSRAALAYSVGASRTNGGRVEEWIPLQNLPPAIARLIAEMTPGEVTEPMDLPTAIALFQLRAIRDVPAEPATIAAIEYAVFHAESDAQAEKVAASADECDDLYGLAFGKDQSVLERNTTPPSSVPRDIALELAKLDSNEAAILPGAGDTRVVMLCQRVIAAESLPSREDVRQQLFNQRLTGFAQLHLDALKAEADIKIK